MVVPVEIEREDKSFTTYQDMKYFSKILFHS